MSKKGGVPNAWDDDDWVSKADVSTSTAIVGGFIKPKGRHLQQLQKLPKPKEKYPRRRGGLNKPS